MNIMQKSKNLLLILTLACCTNLCSAKTLIINSNQSVKKYSLMQSVFQNKFKSTTQGINLKGELADKHWLGQTLDEVNPELIFCIGSKAYLQTSEQAGDTNILFSLAMNWKRFQLTKNTYVIATELPPINILMLYRYYFPDMKSFAILYSKQYNQEWFAEALADAADIGIKITGIPLDKNTDIRKLMTASLPDVDALWLIADPIVISSRAQADAIFHLSDAMNKPVFAYSKAFADFGATFIVSPDIRTMGGQAARMAAKLVAKEVVAEKVQDPAGTYTAINLKKIDRYGIKLNARALASVNDYIE